MTRLEPSFQVQVEPDVGWPAKNALRYRFVCTETADNHVFIETDGCEELEEAIAQATAMIPESCEAWGYKLP